MPGARLAIRSLLLASLVLAVGAASAGAATFCVQDPACVTAGGTGEPAIANAIAAAASTSGRDRIEIGPGTFAEGGLNADSGNPVDIVGAGIGATTIAPAASDDVTTLTLGDPTSTVADLTIALAPGGQETGLRLVGSASDVAVTGAGATWGEGVNFRGTGSFADGSVTLPAANTTGVVNDFGSSAGAVERSTVVAETGLQNVARVSRVRVTARRGIELSSIIASIPTTATIDDTLVQLIPGDVGTGISAGASGLFGGATTVVARHVTLVGNDAAGSAGISAFAATGDTYPASASVTVSSTIVRDFGVDLAQSASGGSDPAAPASAEIAIDYSDFDPAKTSTYDGATPGGGAASGGIDAGSHDLNADPRFADPAGGDFSLRADSPAIDRGSPTLAADEPSVDLAGSPRVVDGDDDGLAVSDMGAFEAPRAACPLRIPGLCCDPPPGGCCEACPPRPVTLTGLRLDPARFVVGLGATTRPRRHARSLPRGTMIRFTLSRAARVTFTIERGAAGPRSGGACVKPTRKLRRARRCNRLVTVLTFARNGSSGANAVPFGGRRGRAPLAPGRYRLSAVAQDLARGPQPSSARFTIVRASRH